jgi:hypothetical protein
MPLTRLICAAPNIAHRLFQIGTRILFLVSCWAVGGAGCITEVMCWLGAFVRAKFDTFCAGSLGETLGLSLVVSRPRAERKSFLRGPRPTRTICSGVSDATSSGLSRRLVSGVSVRGPRFGLVRGSGSTAAQCRRPLTKITFVFFLCRRSMLSDGCA